MSNTDIQGATINPDGKNIKLVKSEAEASAAPVEGQKEPEAKVELESPSIRFDEAGYFVVKIHTSYGYRNILGFLVEAMDWIKLQVSIKHRQEMERQEKLIKPNFMKKVAGRFNLFKP